MQGDNIQTKTVAHQVLIAQESVRSGSAFVIYIAMVKVRADEQFEGEIGEFLNPGVASDVPAPIDQFEAETAFVHYQLLSFDDIQFISADEVWKVT